MNEDLFSGRADVYEQHRPGYPLQLVDYLYSSVGFSPASTIADIGSGTGIFARELLGRGSTVYCVEPNGDMRRQARQSLAAFPDCHIIATAAEHTGLENESFDFITAAQSFHWFDGNRFKEECRRILRKHGKVCLIWNNRDESSEAARANREIILRYCPGFKGFSGGTLATQEEEIEGFFRKGTFARQSFPYDLEYDEDGFIGRNLSASYSPRQGDTEYQGFVSELRQMFRKYSLEGILHVGNTTICFSGEV